MYKLDHHPHWYINHHFEYTHHDIYRHCHHSKHDYS
jgi:hypothetical protein